LRGWFSSRQKARTAHRNCPDGNRSCNLSPGRAGSRTYNRQSDHTRSIGVERTLSSFFLLLACGSGDRASLDARKSKFGARCNHPTCWRNS